MAGAASDRELWQAELRHVREIRELDHLALALQAKEYERRLTDLNGEAGRIHAVLSVTVSRDIWDQQQKTDSEWKRASELSRASLLPRADFQAYKEATDKALQLAFGKAQGVVSVGSVIGWTVAAVASLVVIVGGIVAAIAFIAPHGPQ